jgi:hypothetical protein
VLRTLRVLIGSSMYWLISKLITGPSNKPPPGCQPNRSQQIYQYQHNKCETLLWLYRTAETCRFLDYYSKVLCMGWLLYCSVLYWRNGGDTLYLTPVCPTARYNVPLNIPWSCKTWTPRRIGVWTRACNTSLEHTKRPIYSCLPSGNPERFIGGVTR